jgi:hypothetical protein
MKLLSPETCLFPTCGVTKIEAGFLSFISDASLIVAKLLYRASLILRSEPTKSAMDHLPHPRKGNSVPLRVPLLPHQPEYNALTAETRHAYPGFPKGHDYHPGGEYHDRTAADIAYSPKSSSILAFYLTSWANMLNRPHWQKQ